MANTFPVLGLAEANQLFGLFHLDFGSSNAAHMHPRAAELIYVTKSKVTKFFIGESSPSGAPMDIVENTLTVNMATVFSTGLVHGQTCIDEGGCEFIAFFGVECPGVFFLDAVKALVPTMAPATAAPTTYPKY